MTQLLKTPEVYAVEVPMDSFNIIINNIGCLRYNSMLGTIEVSSPHPNYIDTYLGDFTILGTVTNGRIDFDVSDIVLSAGEKNQGGYLIASVWHPSAHRAFIWFLYSKGLDPSKKFVIIKHK